MNVDLTVAIASSIQQNAILAFIRSYEVTFHGQPNMKVTVVKSYISYESLHPIDTSITKSNTASTSGSPTDKRKQHSASSSRTKRVLPSSASITNNVNAQVTHESPTKKTKEKETETDT